MEVRENFRDSVSTISKEGKRKWIYPKKVKGRFYSYRTYFSWILLAILFIAPFLKYKGHPIFLFNFFERTFIFFGMVFGPHDLHILVFGFIALIIFVFLFTAIFGRVFCGWACPQTVFLEMVFRKIEYWIEGNASEQKKLDAENWNKRKLSKKFFKWTLFALVSFLIANLLGAYLVGSERMISIVTSSPVENLNGFIAVIAFTGIFYFIFSTFREQACTILCPYGRLQSVLLDQNSLIIAYDYKRGEERGKANSLNVNKGDCVDCRLCVDVCPTGIDIRNGLQLECVNCANCIDACNDVMIKINKEKNLIKYSSLNGLINNTKFKLTPRVITYIILLTIIISVFIFLLVNKTDYGINILRTPGITYQDQGNGVISNLYDLNILNKTFNELPVMLSVNNYDGSIKIIGKDIKVDPQGNYDGKFLVMLNRKDLKKLNNSLVIDVVSNGNIIETISTSFLSPQIKE